MCLCVGLIPRPGELYRALVSKGVRSDATVTLFTCTEQVEEVTLRKKEKKGSKKIRFFVCNKFLFTLAAFHFVFIIPFAL